MRAGGRRRIRTFARIRSGFLGSGQVPSTAWVFCRCAGLSRQSAREKVDKVLVVWASMVGQTGLEPAASYSQNRRAANCAIAPDRPPGFPPAAIERGFRRDQWRMESGAGFGPAAFACTRRCTSVCASHSCGLPCRTTARAAMKLCGESGFEPPFCGEVMSHAPTEARTHQAPGIVIFRPSPGADRRTPLLSAPPPWH